MDHTLARNVPGEALDAAVDAHLDRAVALLQELVRAESTLGREAAAQETLAVALADLGFTVEWLPITPAIAGDPAAGVPTPVPGERRVLVARLTGTGAGDGRSLLLNGHLDVVPPGDPDRWAHPPFAGERAGGWLYGRGAGDMKAGWAMAVLATRAMLDAAGPPAADLTAAGVIEEENTGNGTLASVRAGVLADAVLLPEPTDLDLLVAGVGVLWVEVRVQGRQGHALATRDGVSAIDGAWAVVQALRALGDAFNEGLDEPRYFVNVGTFEAGDWTSSVPGSARLGVRIGLPPGLSPADAEAAVRDAVRDAVVADPWLAEHPPEVRASGLRAEAYALEPDAELVAALTAAHVDAHGRAPRVVETTGTTDARFYLNQAGVPALCFGPRVRDMHGVDERVELASIRDGARTLARFMTAWLGAG